MSPPRKDTIINQDNNRIINEEYPILSPLLENILLDINHYLMISIIQIKHKTTLTIIRIIHVLIWIIIIIKRM